MPAPRPRSGADRRPPGPRGRLARVLTRASRLLMSRVLRARRSPRRSVGCGDVAVRPGVLNQRLGVDDEAVRLVTNPAFCRARAMRASAFLGDEKIPWIFWSWLSSCRTATDPARRGVA